MLLDGLRREAAAANDSTSPTVEPVGDDDWDAPAPDWTRAWKDVPEAEPNPAGRD